MDTTTILILLIAGTFLFNLILILTFRAVDRKDKSLKKVKDRIGDFRSELSAAISNAKTKIFESEEQLNKDIEQGKELIKEIDKLLVRLSDQNAELKTLSDVCTNYSTALKSLRLQTEQAEARIQSVKADVERIEEVKSVISDFDRDYDQRKAMLDNEKNDYVKLVETTSLSLKAAAELQKDENDTALKAFSAETERTKNKFLEELGKEKEEYDAILSSAERKATDLLSDVVAKCREEQNRLDSQKKDLFETLSQIENGLDNVKKEKDAFFSSLEEKGKTTLEELESSKKEILALIASTEKETKNTINSETFRIGEVLGKYKKDLETIESETGEKLGALMKGRDVAFGEMKRAFEDQKRALEDATDKLENKRDEILSSLDKEQKEEVTTPSFFTVDDAVSFTEDMPEEELTEDEDMVEEDEIGKEEKEEETIENADETISEEESSLDDDSLLEEAFIEDEKSSLDDNAPEETLSENSDADETIFEEESSLDDDSLLDEETLLDGEKTTSESELSLDDDSLNKEIIDEPKSKEKKEIEIEEIPIGEEEEIDIND